MFSMPDQFSSSLQANLTNQLDALVLLYSRSFDNVEQVSDLNLGLWRSVMEETADTARQLWAAKDLQEVIAVGSAQVKPGTEKLLTYVRHLSDLAATTRADLGKVTEDRITEGNAKVVGLVENAAKNAPAGSEQAIELFKSAVGNANAGYAQLSKSTRQAVEAMEGNLAATVHRFTDGTEKNSHARRARK
jgi:phasin family protein